MVAWQKDVLMIAVGWTLGLFTLPISKNMEVKEKCLNSLYELKRLLEKLSKQMRSPSRTEQGYTVLLMEIKPVIEKLDVEKSGLLFPSYLLDDLIAKSLVLFRKFDPEHENCAYHPTQTSVMLVMTWGGSDIQNSHFDRIEKIQKFIRKPFPVRLAEWLFSFFRNSWQKIFSSPPNG